MNSVFYLPIDIHQFIFCFPSHVCCTPAAQFSVRHLKSNLSISGHQTNSKCQWWMSLWDAWQSGKLLKSQTPLIFIWCDLRWRVCCWSVLLCAGKLVCRVGRDGGGDRLGTDETPSGQTPHPANSHPSGSGRSPLISSHQRVPAHYGAPWVGCQLDESPASLLTKSPSIFQPYRLHCVNKMLVSLWLCCRFSCRLNRLINTKLTQLGVQQNFSLRQSCAVSLFYWDLLEFDRYRVCTASRQ